MKIYDCFIFFNELELLELRLNELDAVVDKFVIVEATKTHQGNEKPLYFEENKKRFSKFLDKIIHVVVDSYPNNISSPWNRIRLCIRYWALCNPKNIISPVVIENYQRNKIVEGLVGCKPNDVIIISDIDEIPNPKKITEYKDARGIKIFSGKLYYFFLNYLPKRNGKYCRWAGSVMTRYGSLTSPQSLRDLVNYVDCIYSDSLLIRLSGLLKLHAALVLKRQRLQVIEDSLWHFSYLGGAQRIIQKLESFCCLEANKEEFKCERKIEEAIRSGRDPFGGNSSYEAVKIDENFPRYLRKNLDKFKEFIAEVD